MNQPSQPFRTHRVVVRSPRATVWRAYTEQEPLMACLVRAGFSMPVCHYDFRPGGTFHYCLRTPPAWKCGANGVCGHRGPERLVMVVSFPMPRADSPATRSPTAGPCAHCLTPAFQRPRRRQHAYRHHLVRPRCLTRVSRRSTQDLPAWRRAATEPLTSFTAYLAQNPNA